MDVLPLYQIIDAFLLSLFEGISSYGTGGASCRSSLYSF